jgi:predicted transcriptional regulator
MEKKIATLLKGHELLASEVSSKLNISENDALKYLNQMESRGIIKTGITEDVPYTKTYRI